jgi:hypothetical protein
MDISDIYKFTTVSENGCWLWTRGRSKGYGTFFSEGKQLLAHRASYEYSVGPIPAGMHVCHRCDTPACINPDHLWLGSHHENMTDKTRKNRGRTGPTAKAGVKFTDDHIIEMRKAYVAGERAAIIAERFGMKRSAINDIVNGRSWKHLLGVKGCPTLEELKTAAALATRNNRKLTVEQVLSIKAALRKGSTCAELARVYGLCTQAIHDIKQGRNWPELS